MTDLLVGLRERGLDATRPVLVVIDGAKALSSAVKAVFDHPVIAWCQLHKIRNVTSELPEALGQTVAKKTRTAHHKDALVAQSELEALARQVVKVPPRRGRFAPGRPCRDPHGQPPGCAANAGPHPSFDQPQ